MAVSPFQSQVFGPLFADTEIVAAFSDAADLDALIRVERALARVEGRLGVIPAAAAETIDAALDGAVVDPATLAEGTRSAGVVLPGLVKDLRKRVGGEAAQFVHWGATSQDVVDTALAIRLADVLDRLEAHLDRLIECLADMAERHRGTVMAARTRTQIAVPTTFGLRAAGWLAPLLRHRDRLRQARPRILMVQFGGAGGTASAIGADGVRVMQGLAQELGLCVPPMPWHTQRDGILECGAWLAGVTASLGKIGTDVALLARSEVAELRPGSGGGSSTMPQKANPVSAELLVALARFTAGSLGTLAQGAIHAEERDGAAWSVEWATLPEMAAATGGALLHAIDLLGALVVVEDAMAARAGGPTLAEAASFVLSQHMPREEAQGLVKKATQSGKDLAEALSELTDAPIDWSAFSDPAAHLGVADAFIDRVLAEARGDG
ncbi:3-carboxy-cis,cis-muconate cycloisomerase [Amorphus coralli]|uniref:3-carboxy-cis,cis-muconate cycloisomerase n=1 Tax=Amorphus coralli TaxID=340680 RepID=UPI000369763A|nr:3-carboxy-cis,cis-muconate cycloisomerase [Amorphus coralli]